MLAVPLVLARGGLAVGAPLALLAALLGSAIVTGVVLVRGRRERRAQLEASRAAAEALAGALDLAAPRPSALPWREGMWQVEGAVEGCELRLLVGGSGVEVSFAVAGAAGLDLARDSDFGRGGIENPREAPYVRLPVEVVGPGWWVRGVDGVARAQALPRALLAALQEPRGRPVALVDGRASTFFAAEEASATRIADFVRGVAGARSAQVGPPQSR